METFENCCIMIYSYIDNNTFIDLEFKSLNSSMVKLNFAEFLLNIMQTAEKISFNYTNNKFIYKYNNKFIYIYINELDNSNIKFELKKFRNFNELYLNNSI